MGKTQNYYLGLDIGTNSVGYAATDEQYNLLRFHGEPAWGSMIFDEGNLKADRRSFRTARRRLDRRQQRVKLLQEIFAKEISTVDERFFIRLQESYKWRDEVPDGHIFFNEEGYTDKDYYEDYPTIHHLIVDLMESDQPHDVRLVYLACAWLVAHRGHFLSNIDVTKLDAVKSIDESYEQFCAFFHDRGYDEPFKFALVDKQELGDCLKEKTGVKAKQEKLLGVLLHGEKASKKVTEELPFSTDAIIRLLAGGKVNLKDLFGKEEYADLETNKISLDMDEDKYAFLMTNLGDDYDLIDCLRALWDWSVLAELLGENVSISKAKVAIYEQHKEDLKTLKYFVRKYIPQKYNEVFREAVKDNYVAYSYHTKGLDELPKGYKKAKGEDFCKYIKNLMKDLEPEEIDRAAFEEMSSCLETNSFMPKQKDTNNRVIPQQLYQYELREILKQAEGYLPFLHEQDADGLTGTEKILSIFKYKLPYFVGPLNKKSEHSWVERRAEGKILPWNYKELIDFDASEDAFIKRMTNKCTYLAGEDVLPKDSLCYQKFMVLNEINNLRINNERISVELKQSIYHDLFEKKKKVRRKDIEEYLVCNNVISENEKNLVEGIDIEIKANLSSFIAFRRFLEQKTLSENDVEEIISRASYAEDKTRVKKWLKKNYPNLSNEDCNYITRIKVKDFGRLSRKFLMGLEGVDKSTGEVTTILAAMWNTNQNLMELLSDNYTFKKEVTRFTEDYYAGRSRTLEKRLDEMYISNSVRRSIYRTLDIVGDVHRAFGDPQKIFIEMTREKDNSKKGQRSTPRREQIEQFYKKCKEEDVRELKHELESLGEKVDNKLQSERLFLYFMQFGRCAYSNTPIDIAELMNGSDRYNVDHIYPRAFKKDDSVINNKVLVLSTLNGEKGDNYPIAQSIREKMSGVWAHWHKVGTISDEKYKRLTRSTPFSEEERYEFINRQLTETSQSTKAVASLLKEKFPEAEIVYTKAGLASEFRKEFGLVKSRSYNDLHHAVDAYLNIVTGNVYHTKFTRNWFDNRQNDNYSLKTKTIFTHPQYVGNEKVLVWDGTEMLEKVKKTAKKNNAHFTKYAYFKKGGLFDQMPVRKSSGLVPLKTGLSTERYGGYNKASVMFFLPVRYKAGKESDIFIMSVELMYGERFRTDATFAKRYAYDRLERLLGKKIDDVSFPLGMRPWKINTMLSLDGFLVCITGKGGDRCLIAQPVMQFSAGEEWKLYIKKMERFVEKTSKNKEYIYDANYDVVTKEKNLELYDLFVDKACNSIYKKRMGLPYQTLIDGREKFKACKKIETQCNVLMNILSCFGRMTGGCDLTAIGGAANSGKTENFSAKMSNWKKYYTDVRIIDQSASGLWEFQSENLLELL